MQEKPTLHKTWNNHDDSTEAPSQQVNSNLNNISAIQTPPMESRTNTSATTATPQMFRQALAEVPDPSSFLQTPKQVDDTDLSWETEDEKEEVSMYTILRDSFQATQSDFSFFCHF